MDEKTWGITDAEVQMVHKYVKRFLPPGFDHEFIADTIVMQSWLKGVTVISKEIVKFKCISAIRRYKLEKRRDENAAYVRMIQVTNPENDNEDNKMLVEQVVIKCLTPIERKLIWCRFWDDQTLNEIADNVEMRREDIQKTLKVALYKMRVELG